MNHSIKATAARHANEVLSGLLVLVIFALLALAIWPGWSALEFWLSLLRA
jgi:hypothetical protein